MHNIFQYAPVTVHSQHFRPQCFTATRVQNWSHWKCCDLTDLFDLCPLSNLTSGQHSDLGEECAIPGSLAVNAPTNAFHFENKISIPDVLWIILNNHLHCPLSPPPFSSSFSATFYHIYSPYASSYYPLHYFSLSLSLPLLFFFSLPPSHTLFFYLAAIELRNFSHSWSSVLIVCSFNCSNLNSPLIPAVTITSFWPNYHNG